MSAPPLHAAQLEVLDIERLRGLADMLELRGKTCSVFNHDASEPYLVGNIEMMGLNKKNEFVLLVTPRAVQLADELTPGGSAMLVGRSDRFFRHVTRKPTDDGHTSFVDDERSVRIVID